MTALCRREGNRRAAQRLRQRRVETVSNLQAEIDRLEQASPPSIGMDPRHAPLLGPHQQCTQCSCAAKMASACISSGNPSARYLPHSAEQNLTT